MTDVTAKYSHAQNLMDMAANGQLFRLQQSKITIEYEEAERDAIGQGLVDVATDPQLVELKETLLYIAWMIDQCDRLVNADGKYVCCRPGTRDMC